MMHTLIAGCTGSGKSYTEKLLIDSLPNTTQLILLDPKRVELRKYKDDTRCIRYAADVYSCLDALKEAERRMDRRYIEMEANDETLYSGSPIVVVVDEAAALLDCGGADRKDAIQAMYNIAFLGRAAKVYLVVCTQRATHDTIPRKISVNLENVVCLRQKKPIDSRELVGLPDAYRFPKFGQCYLSMPDMMRPERMSTEDAVRRIMNDAV